MVQSAFIGQPPLAEDDRWIVKGALMAAGLVTADPSEGLKLPPARPSPDQYRFETRGPAIIAVSSVVIVIMFLVTVARLLARKFRKELKFRLDDWLMVPALILGMMWPVLQICAVKYAGGGKHLYDVTYHEIYMSNWIGSFARIDFFVALAFVKLSITSFNMRLTGLSSRKWMYAHWTFFGILTAFLICSVFVLAFQCIPVVGAWDTIATAHLEEPPRCRAGSDVSQPLSILHILLDFCLLAVPLLVLWRIQLARNTRIRMYILFSIGALCCFAAVMREVSQEQLKLDFTFNFTALIYWSEVDMTLSIIVASLPVLGTAIYGRALFSRKTSEPSGGSSSFGVPKSKRSLAHSEHSREGIMRQDEVEVEFRDRGVADEEEAVVNAGYISQDAYHIEQKTMPWASSQRL
ncbi:MAG: hypothetical protein LQ348_003815 [Seirophora lacunosa]|nr:MAG: hypothetical protein LQ348_003815 [Seirophora lacunosa]